MINSITKNINKIIIFFIIFILVILYYKKMNKDDKINKKHKIIDNLKKINILLNNNSDLLNDNNDNNNNNNLTKNILNNRKILKTDSNLSVENEDNAFKKDFFSNTFKKNKEILENKDYLLANIPVTPCKNSYTNINNLVIDNPYQKYFNRKY